MYFKSRNFVSRVQAFILSAILSSGKIVLVVMMRRKSFIMTVLLTHDPRSAYRLKGSIYAQLEPEHLVLLNLSPVDVRVMSLIAWAEFCN